MAITIKEIAKRANVAVSTVSRALNNKSDINVETREKILEIARESGYKPNNVARSLVMQKAFTIGLIIPDISNPYFAEVALGVESKAKEFGYSVLFCNTGNEAETEKNMLSVMKGKMVDGIIVSLSNNSKEEMELLQKENFPVVQLDRKVSGIEYPGVYIDNVESSYVATKYLIELGHNKIAHFTGDLRTENGVDRLAGFRKAIIEAGISDKNIKIIKGRFSTDSGKKCMRELLEGNFMPTAIFAAGDLQAAGALYVASKAGIKVPDELSIMGHDDIDLSYLVSPNITTIAQPKRKIGELAAEMLLNNIACKTSATVCSNDIILTSNIVIRESTLSIK